MNGENLNHDKWNQSPEFTAYALNELDESRAQEFLKELRDKGISEEEIRDEVASLQLLKATLQAEFSKDHLLRVSPEMREKILSPKSTKGEQWKKWLLGFSVSTSVAVIALVVFVNDNIIDNSPSISSINDVHRGEKNILLEKKKIIRPERKQELVENSAQSSGQVMNTTESVVATRMAKMKNTQVSDFAPAAGAIKGKMIPSPQVRSRIQEEEFNREGYDKIDSNPYTLVSNEPLSTFSVDVDTASYANMRRFLLKGQKPPKNALRIEEMINYFPYSYEGDFSKHPVAIQVDQVQSIWNQDRKIVRVAMKSETSSELAQASKNLVFLMDVSGSMHSPKKLPLLKESMQLLLRKLKKTDTISLVVYAGAAGVILEPTEVREKVKILKALDQLRAGGSTNGGAGIIAAYKMAKMGFIKNGVNRVILATDGDFNVGTSSRGALLDLIEEKAKDDIFLTVVGLGMGNYQDAMLEEISNRGNGNYAYIDSLREANKLFNIDLEKNLTTVAKDVKVQVEFNPNLVKAYRLIGYENRMLAAKDFNDDKKDAGEMGSGHTVTALYEIVPVGGKIEDIAPAIDDLKYSKQTKGKGSRHDFDDELLTVKVRYKSPTGTKSTKFEVPLKNKTQKIEKADRNFKLATAAASLGLKLRDDELTKNYSYDEILKLAKEAKGSDPYEFEAELIEMIELAKTIDRND